MNADVVIIGAGPSGLFAACELARRGITFRIVEQASAPHRQARATALQPGTLEILEAVGLCEPFLKASVIVRGFRLHGPDFSMIRDVTFGGIDCCHDFQCSLPQYETERILEDRLIELGGSVERGVSAISMEREADGVRMELKHADGSVESVVAAFAVCAAGSHHGPFGEALEGTTYEGRFIVADIVADAPLPRDRSNIVCGPSGIVLISPLPHGRWITFQDLAEGSLLQTPKEVAAGLEVRLGNRCRIGDVAWYSEFRAHRRMAKRLTDGRRFLIGDAAHQSSPFGGEGLNAGLHDAFDLAWKLALVLRGEGKRSLLDAYAVERAIADRHVLEVSDGLHKGFMETAEALRHGRPAPGGDPVQAAVKNARAMIDFDYAGSPLIANAEQLHPPWPGQRYADWPRLGSNGHTLLVFGLARPEFLDRFERRWLGRVRVAIDSKLSAARAGVPDGGMALIRPDGHIGFQSTRLDEDAIASLDGHLSTYLIAEQS